ncbi:hypothetical protein HDU67_004933, partial [Dinochytrium kinnereticum]
MSNENYGRRPSAVPPPMSSIDPSQYMSHTSDPRSASPGGPRMISRNAEGRFEPAPHVQPIYDAASYQQDFGGRGGYQEQRRPSAMESGFQPQHRRGQSRGEMGDYGGRPPVGN